MEWSDESWRIGVRSGLITLAAAFAGGMLGPIIAGWWGRFLEKRKTDKGTGL